MVSKMDLVKYMVEKHGNVYDEKTDILLDPLGMNLTAENLYRRYLKLVGQSFECLYHEHISCFSVIKCTECGTIIFERADEDWELNLKCPTCTDYKTRFKFYTVKDLKEDEGKRKQIDMYLKLTQMERERDERRAKRGLEDWERTRKITLFKSENRKVIFQFLGEGWNDLTLAIENYRAEDYGYVRTKGIKIPLGYYSFYLQFIYKHLGKCHPTLRSKYFIGKARENF